MRAYVAVFLIGVVVSAFFTPLVRHVALRFGAVSHPGGRNVNAHTVPRYGGIAICLAFLVALASLYVSTAVTATLLHAETRRIVGLILGGVLLCAVGAVDDTRRLPAVYKLCAQIAAAVIAFGCGFRIDAVLLPFVGGTLSMGVFALPVTALWIVGITNAINLIDGLDGLAGGVVFFAALTNLIVAHVTGSAFVAVAMSAMLGAVLGFLFFNFNPARIFMGDSGSYFLGFVLGTMSLAGAAQKTSTAVAILAPMLALGLPIVDTLLSIARRFLEKRPLFSPDRGHIHHRLLDMGLTHRRAVLILYGICVVLTSTAIAVSLGRAWTVGVALLVASLVIVGLTRFLGSFERLFMIRRQRTRLRTRETELLRAILPDAPAIFAAAIDEETVWRCLQSILQLTGMASAELVAAADAKETIACWGEPSADIDGKPDIVSARYPLGAESLARNDLRFRWRSDLGDVSPQTEVLLQVIADIVTRALVRVGSSYAPRAETETPITPEEPASSAALHPQGSG